MTYILLRNVCRHLGNINFVGRSGLGVRMQTTFGSCFNVLNKIQHLAERRVAPSSAKLYTTGINYGCYSQASLLKSESDVTKTPELVEVKAMPFNLSEGGRYVVDAVKASGLSTVTIFVRSSVVASELVKELEENELNAVEINQSLPEFSCTEHENRIFVVSDKSSATVTLRKSDLIIQVQAPFSGMDAMKQRLHVSNFTNAFASALVLYNSNDSQFISQLGQVTSLTTISPPSFHKFESEEEKQVTDYENLVNLPALSKHLEQTPAVSRKAKSSLFKPVYPEGPKSKNAGYVDRVRLYVIGGSGGNGSPRSGARGGDGGDVILECQPKATLRYFRFKENRRPKAAHGQHCSTRAKRVNGQRGADLIIPVPCGTVIKDIETGHVIADMSEAGQRSKVADGGRGGSPNTCAGGGEKGQRRMVVLEYKMQTDVGLVGFPNAGKSTLLRALSNAKPKVAEYAFTSLKPTLGRVEYEDFSQLTVADLPGLLEGAHQNKGLGLKFLKHCERARALLFVVDVSGFQLSNKHPKRTAFETVCLLAKELTLYRENLVNKPKILVINKMDCVGAEDTFLDIKRQISGTVLTDVLSVDDKSILDTKWLKDFKFEYVMGASALKKLGIEEIIHKLRQIMVNSDDEFI